MLTFVAQNLEFFKFGISNLNTQCVHSVYYTPVRCVLISDFTKWKFSNGVQKRKLALSIFHSANLKLIHELRELLNLANCKNRQLGRLQSLKQRL